MNTETRVAAAALSALFLAAPAALAGSSYEYHYDEAKSPYGPNVCKTSAECDGNRKCQYSTGVGGYARAGICQGTARPTKGPGYHHDESQNAGGAGHCTNLYQCDGSRTCSAAHRCEGTARTGGSAHPAKGPGYHYNEKKSNSRCTNSLQCDGARTCTSFGYCTGTAR